MILSKKDLDERCEINMDYLAESLGNQKENIMNASTTTVAINFISNNAVELVVNSCWTYELVITDFTASLYNHDGECLLVAVVDDTCGFEELLAISVFNTITDEL